MYQLSRGNRVIWCHDFTEVKAQITRIYKNKAEILTDQCEKFKVSLDELELVPLVEKLKPPAADDDARWNPSDFGECDRVIEPDGQITIFDDPNIEPPEPDDYISLAEYEKAYSNWKSVREQNTCTLTDDMAVNFNPKQYDTTEEWLDDSINQFFYEEGEYDLIVPTFPESVREQNNCTLTEEKLHPSDFQKSPNSWIEEKMIKRAGKLHGPYRYERWRDETGKMRSKYLGKKLGDSNEARRF